MSVPESALARLVRNAMGAGAAMFIEKVRDGEVDMHAPINDAFGDFPTTFLELRFPLADDARAEIESRELQRLRTQLAEAEADRDRHAEAHNRACITIAELYAAATGRDEFGPVAGVVEDVRAVRRARDAALGELQSLRQIVARVVRRGGGVAALREQLDARPAIAPPIVAQALRDAALAMPIETLQGADKASVWLRDRADALDGGGDRG